MADTNLDGIAAGSFGSRILTINTVNYNAESFSIDEGSTTVETRGIDGVPNGAVDVVTNPTGSATLQYPASGPTAADPARFQTFTTSVKGTNTNFVIQTVSLPETQGDVRKVNITFRKKFSAS